jgi:hypothetical protein
VTSSACLGERASQSRSSVCPFAARAIIISQSRRRRAVVMARVPTLTAAQMRKIERHLPPTRRDPVVISAMLFRETHGASLRDTCQWYGVTRSRLAEWTAQLRHPAPCRGSWPSLGSSGPAWQFGGAATILERRRAPSRSAQARPVRRADAAGRARPVTNIRPDLENIFRPPSTRRHSGMFTFNFNLSLDLSEQRYCTSSPAWAFEPVKLQPQRGSICRHIERATMR